MKIGIIAYQDCTASMILGMMDILALANTQVQNKKKELFEVSVILQTPTIAGLLFYFTLLR